MTIDWRTMFVPTGSVFELVLRATVMYLLMIIAAIAIAEAGTGRDGPGHLDSGGKAVERTAVFAIA